MKSSKHVETSFVSANNDLMINQPIPISTAFFMKKNFWTKISKNGHCEPVGLTLCGRI